MRVSWKKEMRDKAKWHRQGLFAAACDTEEYKFTQFGMMDDSLCHKMFLFVRNLYETKSPAEAFKKTWPELCPETIRTEES